MLPTCTDRTTTPFDEYVCLACGKPMGGVTLASYTICQHCPVSNAHNCPKWIDYFRQDPFITADYFIPNYAKNVTASDSPDAASCPAKNYQPNSDLSTVR